MPKERKVTLGGGASYTNIRASQVVHTLKVYQDGVRNKAFNYKRKDDGTAAGFTTVFTTDVGDSIDLVGHGRSGLIGRPPNYNAENVPPTTAPSSSDSGGGDLILQIKASDDTTPDVVVVENESEF